MPASQDLAARWQPHPSTNIVPTFYQLPRVQGEIYRARRTLHDHFACAARVNSRLCALLITPLFSNSRVLLAAQECLRHRRGHAETTNGVAARLFLFKRKQTSEHAGLTYTPKTQSLTMTSIQTRLELQSPGARGEAAAAKINPTLEKASVRAHENNENVANAARAHNEKVVATREANKHLESCGVSILQQQQAIKHQQASERRAAAIRETRERGAAEINKVAGAVAALYDNMEMRTREQRLDETMHAVKHDEELAKIAAKGANEAAKVEAAKAKLQAEAEAKAAKIAADQQKKESNREQQLEIKRAKAAAESAKVEAAKESLAMEALAMRVLQQADQDLHTLNRHEELFKVAAKGAAVGAKVEAAHARLASEDEQRAAQQLAGEAAAAARRAEALESVKDKGAAETKKVELAKALAEAEAEQRGLKLELKLEAASARRAVHTEAVKDKGAAETKKVELAKALAEAEAEQRGLKLELKLEAASARRAEQVASQHAGAQAKQEAHASRLNANAGAILAKGAEATVRALMAEAKHAGHVADIAAKGAAEAAKVEAAKAKVEAETAAKAAKLEGKLAAAAERKAAVTYPPCARLATPSKKLAEEAAAAEQSAVTAPVPEVMGWVTQVVTAAAVMLSVGLVRSFLSSARLLL